jgi:hypothetical protein
MIGLILSLDYEIFGDGTGSFNADVIKPTNDFLRICERFNAKGTIFVEVAELFKHREVGGFENELMAVREQLKSAYKRGHDVQLHVHPWWMNAEFRDGKWVMDYTISSLSSLKSHEATNYLRLCKQFLIDFLSPIYKSDHCVAFRAGSWGMMPTRVIYHALVNSAIQVDSSVYKWGVANGKYLKYDYSQAFSNIRPWYFSEDDVNKRFKSQAKQPKCLEFPIYSEKHNIFKFFTVKRFRLRNKVKMSVGDGLISVDFKNSKVIISNLISNLLNKRAMKFDFCKCNLREMKNMFFNIMKDHTQNEYLPIVTIGHSKDFIYKKDFDDFLKFIKSHYSRLVEVVPLRHALTRYKESLRESI